MSSSEPRLATSAAPAASAESSTKAVIVIYADDAEMRERMRLAIGRHPAPDLGPVVYIEASTGDEVIAVADAGEADAFVLDAEAWPAGGIGLCRQMKNEIPQCPPVVVVIARSQDRWLAASAEADAILTHPLNPFDAAQVAAELLH